MTAHTGRGREEEGVEQWQQQQSGSRRQTGDRFDWPSHTANQIESNTQTNKTTMKLAGTLVSLMLVAVCGSMVSLEWSALAFFSFSFLSLLAALLLALPTPPCFRCCHRSACTPSIGVPLHSPPRSLAVSRRLALSTREPQSKSQLSAALKPATQQPAHMRLLLAIIAALALLIGGCQGERRRCKLLIRLLAALYSLSAHPRSVFCSRLQPMTRVCLIRSTRHT